MNTWLVYRMFRRLGLPLLWAWWLASQLTRK